MGEDYLRTRFQASPEEEAKQVAYLRAITPTRTRTPNEGTPSGNNYRPVDRPTTPTMILMEQGGLSQINTKPKEQPFPANKISSATNQQNRITSAGLNEVSIIYNNQSLVMDQLTEEKKQKVGPDDIDSE